MREIRHTAVV